MIFQTFMPFHVEIPKLNPPYSTTKFPEGSRHVISMLSFILGYFTDEHTDESILGFLSTFTPWKPPSVIFYYVGFISDNIHYLLKNLQIEVVFRYTSYLFHMFLYFQSDNFPVNLQKLDIEGNHLSVIFWTSFLRKECTNFSYSEFSELFLHPVITMLTKTKQPRINEEMKKILQLSE